MQERIIILDFGSQFTQLIARRVRETGVYSEIYPCTESPEKIKAMNPCGLILSGSHFSVYDDGAPALDPAFLSFTLADGSPVPVLGICYGLQAMAYSLDGAVEQAERREFGRAALIVNDETDLLAGVSSGATVWMSHGDHITNLPSGFDIIAHTENAPVAAVKHDAKPHYGVQFHPEVVHTVPGKQIIENFVLNICGASGNWSSRSFIDDKKQEIRETVGDQHVILGLSGGVDSSVAAVLLQEALGDQLTCIFVNNGLLRKGEWEEVQNTFRGAFNINLRAVDATDIFLDRLAGVEDPERKRVIIGNTFVEVLSRRLKKLAKRSA